MVQVCTKQITIQPELDIGFNRELIRMTNDELSPNDEIRDGAEVTARFFVIRASTFLRHSPFACRAGAREGGCFVISDVSLVSIRVY